MDRLARLLEFQQHTAIGASTGFPEGQKGRPVIPDLGKEVADAVCVTIPKGYVGELRCAFKAGCDCMRVVYGREAWSAVHVIGNYHEGTQTGDQANHRFTSGVWKLWVYDKTKARFEKIMKESVHLEDGTDLYILGATHRISATNKTCIVCVMDVAPEDKKTSEPSKNDDETDIPVSTGKGGSVAPNLHGG